MSAAVLRVQIERQVLDAASPEAAAAIGRHNDQVRLPGLDDALNPLVIDEEKWAALVRAVGSEGAARLDGRPLFVDAVALRIAASSPTRPEAFHAVRLTAGDTVGDAILASSDAPYDCALAKTRTEAARERTEAADREVGAFDAEKRPASGPRQVRYRAAQAWRENAAAAAACAPQDPAAKAEADAAAKASKDFQLLGGRMG